MKRRCVPQKAPVFYSAAERMGLLRIKRKRPAATVQLRVLKFQGISASMSLLGHRLAMRSRVSVAHA
jgi:hypothetical protein